MIYTYKKCRTEEKFGNVETSIKRIEDGACIPIDENNRDYQILFRSINLKFKYKFGKIDFNPIKKKAILENNDTDHEHDEY